MWGVHCSACVVYTEVHVGVHMGLQWVQEVLYLG